GVDRPGLLPDEPGSGLEEVDDAEHREHPGDHADDRALDERGDVLGDLGFGELDLLADQELRVLRDVLNGLADVGRLLRLLFRAHDRFRLRSRAKRNAPTKAPPTSSSGWS